MGFGPRLPETAPFSLNQRAWLDGYIAGWFSFVPDTVAQQLSPGSPVAEDFPWHDPSLSLEERLALAEGRRPERVLMAAMAQLDCGQCGYLCQTYAEAITRGEEGSLNRCVPGGKATSRKLKQLVGGGLTKAAVALPGVAPVAAARSSAPGAPADRPFVAEFRAVDCLNGPGSAKEVRHVVLAAEDGMANYQVGDSLGVFARNCTELVAAIVERLGAKAETPVLSPDGIERPLVDALAGACEIRRPSDQAIEVLASRALDRDESVVLQAMAEGYPGAGPEDADLLDLFENFSSARPPLSELISALGPLQPRLYSIASSPKHSGGRIDLAVAVVRYERRARRRGGVASTFLADRAAVGAPVRVFVRHSPGFRLPLSREAPIIMIGPGTGIAPFRAFLQERRATGADGRNWLFFGNPRRQCDFLFEAELSAYCRDGLLTRLDLAFSRDQEDKIYVQHRLLEQAAALWSWLEEGAYLYLCGDAQRMARDVETSLAYIIAREGHMDAAAAKAYLARLGPRRPLPKRRLLNPENRMFLETVDQFAMLATAKAAFLRRSPLGFWISSMMAGAYVGLGIILIFCVGANVDPSIRPVVMGASFGIALTLVIFAGSDLFTGHTMFMSFGWLRQRTGFRDLAACWGASWTGNLAGSAVLAGIFVAGGGGLALAGKSPLIINVAAAKMNAPALELVARAMLCNWLVCLAIWTSARMTNDTAKCIAIFWCLYAFIASGFEHSVANMTLLSIALLAEHPPTVTLAGLGWNLLWVTIGNAISGAGIMGLGYWAASRVSTVGERSAQLAAAE